MMNFLMLISWVTLCFRLTTADTPANCTFEDAQGTWSIKAFATECCSPALRFNVELKYPNLAIDQFGNQGTWTMIYNQGFEIKIANRKWLGMFAYGPDGESYCHDVQYGFSRDVLLRQQKTFTAYKVSAMRIEKKPILNLPTENWLNQMYQPNPEFVKRINAAQNSWVATEYPELMQYTLGDLRRRAGGPNSLLPRLPKKHLMAQKPSTEIMSMIGDLPTEFDWRHPSGGGKSPVTPVRNQENCGSCYAFASVESLEARVRLMSNFRQEPILSPQDIVNCSPYSQGCNGGFPYLIAGKYAEEFGIPLEECAPYTGKDGKCQTQANCTRYYATNYEYIGGYYGATNEQLMMLELVRNGPFAVGFEVYNDFVYYKSGVYHHTFTTAGLTDFNPFELTNHAVLLVGYGVDSVSGESYWAVKNSWGRYWGEDGFFRIRRGSDECAIESLAVSIQPVL